MKEITKTYKLYKFEELDKEIQEELIKEEAEQQYKLFCNFELQELMIEEAKELLQKYFGDKATYKQVYYDLSYCQGSGAMIEFDVEYYKNIFEVRQHGHYYHERAFNTINKNWFKELSPKTLTNLYDKIVNMNSELVKYGYSLLEDEEYFKDIAKEYLIEDEKDYLINGMEFKDYE